MKYLDCSKVILGSLLIATIASANVTFNGTALLNTPGLAAGDVGILLVDNSNSGFSSISIRAGSSLTSSSTYGDFSALTSGTASTIFGGTSLALPLSNYSLPSVANTGDKFAILVFSTSLTTAIGGDTYKIWTDSSWVIPADGSTTSFQITPANGFFTTLTSASSFNGTVSAIPEPATYAALFGLGVLGMAAFRRRRTAA
jgi:hypothetical protein